MLSDWLILIWLMILSCFCLVGVVMLAAILASVKAVAVGPVEANEGLEEMRPESLRNDW